MKQEFRFELRVPFRFDFFHSLLYFRNHIVEDAFHYLHKLNVGELKRAFRVKFLNAEGLEEAGVDQAGIFKGYCQPRLMFILL